MDIIERLNREEHITVLHITHYMTEAVRALSEAKKMLDKGFNLCIFPEGTRSKDREIHRFHQGAFHMAKEHHVDIIPIFLTGLGDVLPKDELAFRRGKMHMEIGKRMTPEEFEGMETRT